MSGDKSDKLSILIAELDALNRTQCIDRWREMFGRPPPKYLSPQFMKRVLIWEMQTRALGSVSAKTTRRLKQIASGDPVAAMARPGACLVRE